MEVSFVFHDKSEDKLCFKDEFVEMEDSINIKTLPRIGETIVFDTGSGLEEFFQLKIDEREYLEKFMETHHQVRCSQYRFTVIDIVHFTAGNIRSIYIKPKLE